jgi:hypothetical protein
MGEPNAESGVGRGSDRGVGVEARIGSSVGCGRVVAGFVLFRPAVLARFGTAGGRDRDIEDGQRAGGYVSHLA